MRAGLRALLPAIVLLVLPVLAAATDDDVATRARAVLDAGNPREAIALLDRSLGQKPNDPALLLLRGEAKLDLGKTRDARSDLERAARVGPEWLRKAAGMRARIEFLYANDAQATKLLEDAPEDDPDRATLPLLIRGPFADVLGDVAPVATGRSSGRHYLVYSDVGLTEEALTRLKESVAAEKAKGKDNLAARLQGLLKPCAGVREGAKLLETIYKAYEQVFPFEKDAALVHRVYLFATRDAFLAFATSIGEEMSGADGFYRSDTRILAIDAEEEAAEGETFGDNARDTIFHEGFHQFVRFHAPGLPTWLDEGLAEYFGPSKILGQGKLEVGVVKRTVAEGTTRLQDVRAAIKKGKAPPLRKFLQTSDDDFTKDDVISDNYAQAWSVVHFLVTKGERRPLVTEYFKLMRTGKTRESAFAETFGKIDLDELDREWRRYVEGL